MYPICCLPCWLWINSDRIFYAEKFWWLRFFLLPVVWDRLSCFVPTLMIHFPIQFSINMEQIGYNHTLESLVVIALSLSLCDNYFGVWLPCSSFLVCVSQQHRELRRLEHLGQWQKLKVILISCAWTQYNCHPKWRWTYISMCLIASYTPINSLINTYFVT